MREMKKILLLTFMAAFTFLTACQQDINLDNETEALDDQSLIDNITVESTFDEVLDINTQVLEANATEIDKAAKNDEDSITVRTRTWYCDSVRVKIIRRPNARRVVINFGEEGTTCKDGKTRKGKIIITFQKRHMRPGGRTTTTFDGYSVNDIQVAGTKIVTRLVDDNGRPRHNIQVMEASLTFPDGTQTSWESERTRVWRVGFLTPFKPEDDVFSLAGTYSGNNRDGVNYSMETTSPLIYRTACWFQGFRLPSAGTLLLDSDNRSERTVDFGEGACDDEFTVTIGDQVFVING